MAKEMASPETGQHKVRLHQSGRRSPSDVGATEQASYRIDLERTRMPANSMIELTI